MKPENLEKECMAINNDIMVQGVDPLQAAAGDMTLAQIDDIERRAHATAVILESENAQQGDSANETKVAGEMGLEIAGGGMLKLASTALEIVSDRVDAGQTSLSSPTAGKTDGIVSGRAMTMDQSILNSFSPDEKAMNLNVARRLMSGEEVVMSANIAHSSLRGQDKDCVGSWAVSSAKVDGVPQAKRLTFDKIYANQHALDSVPGARAQYGSTMHRAMQMAPGMSPSPNLRPTEMVAMAEDRSEELDRWRDRGEGTWA